MSVVPAGDSWLGSSPSPSDWRRSRIRNASVLSPGYSGAAPVPTEYCTVVPMEMVSEWGEIGTTEQQPFDEVSGGLTHPIPHNSIVIDYPSAPDLRRH